MFVLKGLQSVAKFAAVPTEVLQQVLQSPPEESPKKVAPIPKEKRKVYEQYKEEICTTKRMKVDPQAHKWMVDTLIEWQAKSGKKEMDLPFPNEWYLDKRVEAIQKGLLTKAHSDDVVRSHLRAYVKNTFTK